jgi:DNA-binding transcriptional LysR family regulator
MFSLNELEIFLTAAEFGNFSEAARRMHISQPAVSQAISSLEKHFGIDLFQRQGRSVRLTEAGQALRPMAQELLSSARRLDETMVSLHGEVIGEINIGCSTTSGKYLLPGLIGRFRDRFPQVRINVLVSSRRSVIERLLSGKVALGISSKRIEHRDLEYQDFFTDEVILIASGSHPWASYRRVYPDDLLDEPIILREDGAGTLEVLYQALLEHDISPDMLNVAMVLGNAEAIELAVEEGLGIAFISRLAAYRCLALGRIVEIKVEGMSMRRDISLVRNRRFPATRAQAEFWDLVGTEETRSDFLQMVSEKRLPGIS